MRKRHLIKIRRPDIFIYIPCLKCGHTVFIRISINEIKCTHCKKIDNSLVFLLDQLNCKEEVQKEYRVYIKI